MKYLNLTDHNKNFFIKDGLLYNVNSTLPIADLSNGRYLDKGEKMRETVEFYPSGAKVKIECGDGTYMLFYGNNSEKPLVQVTCYKGQNKDNVSILPIDLGVFSCEYVGKKLIYRFVDYKNESAFADHNFTSVYKNVEKYVERKSQRRDMLNRTERLRNAIANMGKTEVRERRA